MAEAHTLYTQLESALQETVKGQHQSFMAQNSKDLS
uniref:I-kappa-kinase-beta NEMO binding domain-containing protein n=1 Tax=Jaculus jaculus TaxID=51337 RepID=A0A8C5K0X6_JACJA